MIDLGVPDDDVPVAVPVESFDQAVLLAQYHLVDLSAPLPYVHRVTSIPWSHGHESLAAVLQAMHSASRLSRTALFRLTYASQTSEMCQGEVRVRPVHPTESAVRYSGPL